MACWQYKEECMKKTILFIILTTISLSIIGCRSNDFMYNGEYPSLFCVAINSIPLTKGYEQSEIRFNPTIVVLDEDDFGRVLFSYYEDSPVSTYSLLIMQTGDNEKVYFYPDYNFISSDSADFSNEAINNLKNLNDWNQEYEEAKFVDYPITSSKSISPLIYENIKPFYEFVFPGDEHFSDDRWIKYFISDQNERQMYAILSRDRTKFAVLLFNSDGTYDCEKGYLILTDFYAYQDQLKEFKENNNWNEPTE